ncbi:helix-turn-helix domain-containing protein [Streptomyces sp900105755]|uniref:helix-turn-helix domain-containing protein n=1 Tax=Streptomyces sp. 900105755 TaxID=3154389 RepID=UPI00332A9ED6
MRTYADTEQEGCCDDQRTQEGHGLCVPLCEAFLRDISFVGGSPPLKCLAGIMSDEIALHSSIGRILRDHQKRLQITQAEFAARLGISQPYLSRILRGQRSAVSLRLWNKILEVVPHPELHIVNGTISDLSDAYDRALLALGRGNQTTAEILLGQIVARRDDASAGSTELSFRAQFHLAGILRDQNRLGGADGAVVLYTDALSYYRDAQAHLKVEETTFMLGACKEMSGSSATAFASYQGLLKQVDPLNQSLVVRLHGRLGALATKMNRLDEADVYLRTATQKSIHLDDSYPYSYYNEKMAILRTRQGLLDDANSFLQSARREIDAGDSLRKVQSLCVEANIFIATSDLSRAWTILQKALATARKREYAHQEAYIKVLLTKISLSLTTRSEGMAITCWRWP